MHLSSGRLYAKVGRHKDCCWCTGPPGEHFDMTERSLQIGRPVILAGFPAATDQELSRRPVGQPMITFGHVSCFDRDLELAAATYQEGRVSAIATSNNWNSCM